MAEPNIQANYRDSSQAEKTATPVISQTTVIELQPEPTESKKTDTGLTAWLQCVAGFCIFFNTWGLLNSFGLYQTVYVQTILSNESASAISWIGTLQAGLLLLGSLYSAVFYDLGYLRLLLVSGSLFVTLGMFLTSISTQYWHFLLAQGLLIGIGMGCLFLPTLGLLASWFVRRRGLAMGLASSGSAIGGIIYPLIFPKLLDQVGFAWYCRIVGFICLALFLVPIVFLKSRSPVSGIRQLVKLSIFKEKEYSLYTAALSIGYFGLYVPYFYIQLYALEQTDTRTNLVIYLLALVNVGGFFGRLLAGALTDKIGPLNTFIAASCISSILMYGWIGVTNQSGILAFAVLYGFFSAALIALPATIVAISLCPDMREYPVRVAMPMVPASIGILVGNPIAGALLTHGWHALQGYAASCVLVCTILTTVARVVKFGTNFRTKC